MKSEHANSSPQLATALESPVQLTNHSVIEELVSGKPSRNGNQPVRVPKAGAMIADQIRREIVQGNLREGDSLPPETTCMEQFDVSRPTLREAFRILEAESLIHVRRGGRGGARVRLPDVAVVSRNVGALLQLRGATVADVYESRVIIEPHLVAKLAKESSDDVVATLSKVIERERAALQDHERFAMATADFHRLLAELSNNQTLRLFSAMLDEIFRLHAASAIAFQKERFNQTELNQTALDAQIKLVSLIEAGDAERSEMMWRRHLIAVGEVTLGSLGHAAVLDLYN